MFKCRVNPNGGQVANGKAAGTARNNFHDFMVYKDDGLELLPPLL
jgi:hypothetical protein